MVKHTQIIRHETIILKQKVITVQTFKLVLQLNPFHATDLFLTPWKYQKTSGVQKFSGDIERDHWHEIVKYKQKSQKSQKSHWNPIKQENE